jgi:Ca2+-binding RTX toxin-like protein
MGGNDTIIASVGDDRNQIHSYAHSGDDLTYLDFGIIEGFAHGHHARGGEGADIFDFTNTSNVSGFVVGRIEDFDIRSDVIRVEGEPLDFSNLPDNVRVVAFNGHHDDPGSHPQPYLHISTPPGGDIFYALEGARVDMDREDIQEPHFLSGAIDPWALDEIDYSSPNNYLPDDQEAVSGETINDLDVVRADVLETIVGSNRDDLISAGLNDDTVRSGAGDDTIWGGSGNDVVYGGKGDDQIEGSRGNDHILGGVGQDTIHGGESNDLVDGGAGRDDLTGGDGEDQFAFGNFERGFDLINDFVPGTDKLGIDHPDISGLESVRIVQYSFEGEHSTLIRFLDDEGEVDRSMGGIVLRGVSPANLSKNDFSFGEPQFVEEHQDDNAIVLGADGADSISGTDSADLIFAVRGDDTVDGGKGNDLINGGEGRDDLSGGEGNDLFVFSDFERGFDVIRDFSLGSDQVVLDSQDALILEDLRFLQYSFEGEPSTLIRFLDDGGEIDRSLGGIVLKGVLPTELNEDNFEFVNPGSAGQEDGNSSTHASTIEDPEEAWNTVHFTSPFNLLRSDIVHEAARGKPLNEGEPADDFSGHQVEGEHPETGFYSELNVIRDFALGEDQLVLGEEDALILEDLRFAVYSFEEEPSTLIRFLGEDGAIDESKGCIILKGVLPTELSEQNFAFGEQNSVDPSIDENSSVEGALITSGGSEESSVANGQEILETLFDAYECVHGETASSAFEEEGLFEDYWLD